MDVSMIVKSLSQEWTVDEDGNGIQLLGEVASYTCSSCRISALSSWEAMVEHYRANHSPEAAATGNGVPSDVTSVQSHHSVQLETPDAE